MKSTLRILLVDDHGLFAEALGGVLQGLADEVTVRGARSAEDALALLASTARPDLVLLDLGLPGLKGRAAFEAVAAQAGGAPVVIVSGSEPAGELQALVRAGARGYVHKRATSTELLAVLRFVLAGGTHIPPEAMTSPASTDDVPLTPRQREVLALLARGESNRDIAQALGISEATVRVHVSSVMRALDVENRTQAATSALGRRLADEA